MITPFSRLLDQASANSGVLSAEVPNDWLQGRSIYGGLQTALALRAMKSLEPSRPIRSLQTNFIGPLAGHVRAQATRLRSGKNTTQIEAKLYGDNGLTTQVLGVFGASRASEIQVDLKQENLPPVEPVIFPSIAGLTPSFTQHYTLRLLRGHLPFSGIRTTKATYELSLLDEGPCTESHVVMFADVVPPLGLSMLDTPTFGSTLSWFLEFLETPAIDIPLERWRLDAELVSAAHGYSNQSSILWSPRGQALALSRQTMMVFA